MYQTLDFPKKNLIFFTINYAMLWTSRLTTQQAKSLVTVLVTLVMNNGLIKVRAVFSKKDNGKCSNN